MASRRTGGMLFATKGLAAGAGSSLASFFADAATKNGFTVGGDKDADAGLAANGFGLVGLAGVGDADLAAVRNGLSPPEVSLGGAMGWTVALANGFAAAGVPAAGAAGLAAKGSAGAAGLAAKGSAGAAGMAAKGSAAKGSTGAAGLVGALGWMNRGGQLPKVRFTCSATWLKTHDIAIETVWWEIGES